MAGSEHLDVLEERLNKLESLVFGTADKDAIYPKEKLNEAQCIDTLVDVQTKLNATTAGKKKIQQLYERLPELKQYLDPAAADEMTLSEAAKIETILAEEDFIQQQAKRLEAVKKLEEFMESEHIRAVPSLVPKLQALSQVQLEQQDKTANLTEGVQQMLSTYNSIISLLSKQFVQWDEVVTKLEMAQSKGAAR